MSAENSEKTPCLGEEAQLQPAPIDLAAVAQLAANLEFAWQKGVFLGQTIAAQFSVLANLMMVHRQMEVAKSSSKPSA